MDRNRVAINAIRERDCSVMIALEKATWQNIPEGWRVSPDGNQIVRGEAKIYALEKPCEFVASDYGTWIGGTYATVEEAMQALLLPV